MLGGGGGWRVAGGWWVVVGGAHVDKIEDGQERLEEARAAVTAAHGGGTRQPWGAGVRQKQGAGQQPRIRRIVSIAARPPASGCPIPALPEDKVLLNLHVVQKKEDLRE